MPAKNTIGRFHGRHPLINKKMWRRYVKETGNKIPYTLFKSIFEASMEETKKWILREPVGFKFPHKIGNIAINKFKTYGDFKTYTNVRHEGKPIRNFNLHTGGHTFRIQWFYSSRQYSERFPFWFFDACRDFKRNLAKVLKGKSAPLYNTYMQDHFSSTTK